MAEGDFTIHQEAKLLLAKKLIDFLNDTFKVTLHTGWTPNVNTDEYFDDIQASEIALSGYTAGGVTLTTKVVARDDGNGRVYWDFDDPTWASIAAGSVTRAAIRLDTGTATTSVIVGNIEIATNANGQSYTLPVNASGGLLIS